MITRLLVGANIVAFIWEVVAGHMDAFTGGLPRTSLVYLGTLAPLDVTVYHEYYRLVTSGFLHWGLLHIAVNMFSLFVLGTFVERTAGSFRMALIYLVSLIGASIAVVYFSIPNVPTLGASGAIFGLFGALFAIGLKYGRPGMEMIKANIGILVINLVFTFSVPEISKAAHVGGLVVGFVFTYLIFYAPRPVYARVVDTTTGQALESHIETP